MAEGAEAAAGPAGDAAAPRVGCAVALTVTEDADSPRVDDHPPETRIPVQCQNEAGGVAEEERAEPRKDSTTAEAAEGRAGEEADAAGAAAAVPPLLAPFLSRLPLSPADEAGVEAALKVAPDLAAAGVPPAPRPRLPPGFKGLPLEERLAAAQAFIASFCYNFTRAQYFDVDKARPLASLLATARAIVRAPLPIKCVEAVFLGLLLTQGMEDVERIPVSFKVGPA